MQFPIFYAGDKVYYTGTKFADQLNGKPGWICAPVEGRPNVYVVEFPDTRKDSEDSDDYVMDGRVLAKKRSANAPPDKKQQEEIEVQPRRKRRDDDE